MKPEVKNLNSRGFTLIEMMVSIVVITLVVITAVYALILAHQMSEDSRSRLLAINAARSTLEMVKRTPLEEIPNIDTDAFIPEDLPNGEITIGTNPVLLEDAQIATVTITVSWSGPKNMPRDLAVTTMRSRF